ncbi:FtsQ-type POTRA domain-containing protein [candidate division KSB1 bacterium]|nr:FtsQ-type POTRA domain-containing protein [candidate division KSB1 bacterium]
MLIERAGKLFFVLTTLIVLLLGTIDWMRGKKAFSAKAIQVKGTRQVSREKVIREAKIDSSQDIFELKPGQIAERIKKQNPLIQQVQVTRQFPATVEINVKEAKPYALLYDQQEVFGIDGEGVLLQGLPAAARYDLPLLTGIQLIRAPAGKYALSTGFTEVIACLKLLKNEFGYLWQALSEIQFRERTGIILYLMGHSTPIVLGRDAIPEKIKKLSLVFPYLQPELEHIHYLDLRFAGQVIVKSWDSRTGR